MTIAVQTYLSIIKIRKNCHWSWAFEDIYLIFSHLTLHKNINVSGNIYFWMETSRIVPVRKENIERPSYGWNAAQMPFDFNIQKTPTPFFSCISAPRCCYHHCTWEIAYFVLIRCFGLYVTKTKIDNNLNSQKKKNRSGAPYALIERYKRNLFLFLCHISRINFEIKLKKTCWLVFVDLKCSILLLWCNMTFCHYNIIQPKSQWEFDYAFSIFWSKKMWISWECWSCTLCFMTHEHDSNMLYKYVQKITHWHTTQKYITQRSELSL